MTNEEKDLKAEGREDIVVPSIALQNIVDVTLEKPYYDPEFILKKEAKYIKPLSMSQGTAAFCLQSLVAHEDRNAKEAGDRIFATKGTDSEKWNVADLKTIMMLLK